MSDTSPTRRFVAGPMPPTSEQHPAVDRSAPALLPVAIGLALGVVLAAAPFAVWWVPQATVYAMVIAVIAAVYVGFAVADGRPRIIAVESIVAGVFILLAALAVNGSPWLLVAGLVGHGVKDLVQHRTGFVKGTRWWPPFCVAVDWVAGGMLAIAIVSGAQP